MLQSWDVQKILVVSLTFASVFSTEISAQKTAFQEVDIVFSVQENVNQNDFHDYWLAKPAVQIELDTPFYFGHFFTAAQFTLFKNRGNDLPNISNIQANVGWGKRFSIFKGLEIGASAGVLFSMMSFQNVSEEHQIRAEKQFGSTSPESEIGFLMGADLSYDITNKWGIRLQWSRNLIYTRHKMKLNYLGIGIYRNIQTPDWLQKILR